MTKFSHLIPAEHFEKVVDYGTHVVIGGEIFITDNEEIAIAIVDSTKHDFLLVLQREPNKFSFYSNHGVNEGGQSLIDFYINDWFGI
ncbi:hypothetical protein OMDBNIEC_00068 [Salmonella phage STP-SP5]|nr:hypothetical protein OMDBNIEC_00068 [Salmonella phage STP-SP5]